MSPPGACVLLTGATGFVGKVVLEALVRRQADLGVGRVVLLIRPRPGENAAARFRREVAASPCFARHDPGWEALCEPVDGDVVREGLALAPEVAERLAGEVTHVVHCAASVAFDLPLPEAARANVAGALHVQAFAQGCPRLRALVAVSTAYVTPHPGDGVPVPEALPPLALDPEALYAAALDGAADERATLARTGHPNTYTLTKALAEHLLAARCSALPLALVRPSIVGPCAADPLPGWIDSRAAFAAFVVLFALGHLRAVRARPEAVPDLVPCDRVAEAILEAAFLDPPTAGAPTIRHAVAGLAASAPVAEIARVLEAHYAAHPVVVPPRFRYVGADRLRWTLAHDLAERLPLALGAAWLGLRGAPDRAERVRRLARALERVNATFAPFTHRTYAFETARPLGVPEGYLRTAAEGVARHLLGRDPARVPVAGLTGRHAPTDDAAWARRQPHGNRTVRALGWGLRKALRRAAETVTFDEASFRAALAERRPDDLVVLVPSHRSYMDFMVCPLLCFAHPELGLRPPRIAATEDFACVPLVGPLMRQAGAFFIKRGLGREDPTLTRQVAALAREGDPLKFYIEGTRSRGRRFLAPRRGLLRALQRTGQPCLLLPVAISHDRLAEDESFLRELRGEPKPTNRLGPLLAWLDELRRGHVHLGPIHLRCGAPLRLDAETDVHEVARAVVAELQRATAPTTHHLRAFAAVHPGAPDPAWLREAIERRGGRVVESTLVPGPDLDPLLERCFQGHWMHLFYAEALARAPDNPAVADHVARYGFWVPPAPTDEADPRTEAVLEALFAPVCRDYRAVARAVAERRSCEPLTGKALVARLEGAFLPDVEGALAALAARGFLREEGGAYWPTGRTEGLEAYAEAAAWPSRRPEPVPTA